MLNFFLQHLSWKNVLNLVQRLQRIMWSTSLGLPASNSQCQRMKVALTVHVTSSDNYIAENKLEILLIPPKPDGTLPLQSWICSRYFLTSMLAWWFPCTLLVFYCYLFACSRTRLYLLVKFKKCFKCCRFSTTN